MLEASAGLGLSRRPREEGRSLSKSSALCSMPAALSPRGSTRVNTRLQCWVNLLPPSSIRNPPSPGWRAPISPLITCPAIRRDSQACVGRLQLRAIYLLLLSRGNGCNLKVQVSATLPDENLLKHFHIAPVSCHWKLPPAPTPSPWMRR